MVAALAAASSCGDQVVGEFDASGLGTTSAFSATDAAATAGATGTADAPSRVGGTSRAGSQSGDTTQTDPTLGPCTPVITEPFDPPPLDDTLWVSWQEEDSSIGIVNGRLRLVPPTDIGADGPADSGVVTRPGQVVPLDNRAIRLRVDAAPGASDAVTLFLMFDDPDSDILMTIKLKPSVSIEGRDPTGAESYSERFDDIVAPNWVGLAAVDGQVHYQISADGLSWTTLYIGPVIAGLAQARPLIMAQTYGPTPSPSPIYVDDFSVCAF